MNYTFELKELQATHIVYLHHQGDMSLIPSSIRKLMQWAGPKGLINGPANKLISVYQHEGKELSVDIGLTVPQEVVRIRVHCPRKGFPRQCLVAQYSGNSL